MPIHIDPNSLYTLLELRDMFDMPLDALRQAMRSPARRLEALKFGGEVYVRGEHLLRYMNGQVPDNPTDFSTDSAPAAHHEPLIAPGQPITSAILKPGEIDEAAPKVIGGRVKSGHLVKPPTDEQPKTTPSTGGMARLAAAPPSSGSGAGVEVPPTRRGPVAPAPSAPPNAPPVRPAPAASAPAPRLQLSGPQRTPFPGESPEEFEMPRRRGPIGAPPPSSLADAGWGDGPEGDPPAPQDDDEIAVEGVGPDMSPPTPSRRALNLDVDALVAEAQRIEKERDSGDFPVQRPNAPSQAPQAGQQRPANPSGPKKDGADPSDFSHWL